MNSLQRERILDELIYVKGKTTFWYRFAIILIYTFIIITGFFIVIAKVPSKYVPIVLVVLFFMLQLALFLSKVLNNSYFSKLYDEFKADNCIKIKGKLNSSSYEDKLYVVNRCTIENDTNLILYNNKDLIIFITSNVPIDFKIDKVYSYNLVSNNALKDVLILRLPDSNKIFITMLEDE